MLQGRQGFNNNHRRRITWNWRRLLNTERISPRNERRNLKSHKRQKSTHLKEACFMRTICGHTGRSLVGFHGLPPPRAWSCRTLTRTSPLKHTGWVSLQVHRTGTFPGDGRTFGMAQCPVSVTPASWNVLMSVKTLVDASMMFMARAEPVPSPSLMSRSRIGLVSRSSIKAR